MPPLKVLVSAYACEPQKGSEPGSGWQWVRQIAKFNEAWVLTRRNNRAAIEAALAAEPLPNVHFVYLDLPRWARFWKKAPGGIYLYYYLWQCYAYFVGKKLHRKVNFDFVHHVTFAKYWTPSFLAMLKTRFVWGPVGGGESMPLSFWWKLRLRGKLYELLRVLARAVCELDPFVHFTARKAALTFATTPETERRLRSLGCKNVVLLSNAALNDQEFRKLSEFPLRRDAVFRAISIGTLSHLKGFDLALRAFARLRQDLASSCEYWIIGSGVERARLEAIARQLGVADRVTFWGALPRSKVLEMIGDCDVMLHPALHDSSGWVSVEAMAAGRPVICLNLGGIALQVTDETGVKLPARSPQQAITDMADALLAIAGNPERRVALGEAARAQMAKNFNWDRRGGFLSAIYQQLQNSPQSASAPQLDSCKTPEQPTWH